VNWENLTALEFKKSINKCDGIWWHAEYPEHFAADTTKRSAEKGEKLIKEDNSPFELYT